MDKWKVEDTKLLKTTETVDYDVESFAKHLTQRLDSRIKHLTALRGQSPSLLQKHFRQSQLAVIM